MPDSLKIWGTDYTGIVGFKAIEQTNGPAGKNLYNSSTRTDGYYLNGSGVPTSESTCSYSDYIAVIPGENYVWSGISSKTGSNNKRAIGYNVSKSYVQVVNNVSVSGSDIPYENSFTVPSGIEYIRISFNTADSEMMVEHGATKTNYEPYTNLTTHAYFRPQGTKSISQNGTGIDVAEYATVDVNVPGGGGSPTLQTKTKNYTPTESQQTETVTADNGYDGLDTVNITVGAISSSYVGTEIARWSSSDLTASGATVSVPSGYYESAASKSVASGTEGTPTATKGMVSNHSVTVTPSVTNTVGYISGGTHTGTAVTVSASELVSGTKSISANGTGIDVTTYAAVDVAVPGSTPNLQAKTNIAPTESSQTITADTGYDGLSSIQINAVSSSYVGSSIARRSSSDVDAGPEAGEYKVIIPSGYYESSITKYAPGGSVSTPSAIKGAVSNYSVSITPSVSYNAGYIGSTDTKTGTAVTVSASELVSGSATQSSNGTYDVTNLSSLVVAVPIVTYYTGSAEPSASLGSNGDIYLQTES